MGCYPDFLNESDSYAPLTITFGIKVEYLSSLSPQNSFLTLAFMACMIWQEVLLQVETLVMKPLYLAAMPS